MYRDSPFAHPISPFERPVPVPGLEPDAAPLCTLSVNATWVPYVIGALKVLLLQSTWDTDDPGVLALTQQRVFNLIDQFSCGSVPTGAIVCDRTFSTDGAGGWVAIHANGIDYAIYHGSYWSAGAISREGAAYTQLQMELPLPGPSSLYNLNVTYNAVVGGVLYVGDHTFTNITQAAYGAGTPGQAGVAGPLPLPDTLRINMTGDHGNCGDILIEAVEFTIVLPSGSDSCP